MALRIAKCRVPRRRTGIDVGAAREQELDDVGGGRGGGGKHQSGSSFAVPRIDVRAALDQHRRRQRRSERRRPAQHRRRQRLGVGVLQHGLDAFLALCAEGETERQRTRGLDVRATPDEQTERRLVSAVRGEDERRDLAKESLCFFRGVRAAVEQHFDDRGGAWKAGGDEQRRAADCGARVDVRAAIEQDGGLLAIHDGEHERGRAAEVRDVRIGTRVEQLAHRGSVAVEHRVHQGRRSAGAASAARRFVAISRATRARSPVRSAFISAVAPESGAGSGASPDSSSGHSAP